MMRVPRMVLVLAVLLGCAALRAQGPVTVDESQTRLSFPSDHFLLDLPVRAAGPAGVVSISGEVLGPGDEVESEASAECTLAQGVTHCRLALPPYRNASSFNGDLTPLLRVRYRVGTASGILSVDRIAPELFELHVAALRNIRSGGTYTAHLRALHPLTGEPRASVAVTAIVTASFSGDAEDQVIERLHVRTDERGFGTITFTAPDKPGLASIKLEATGSIANLHPFTNQTFNVQRLASLDVTTDKPLYQPGQTVHTRVLLLDDIGHARAKRKIAFDFHDPDSTLVYRTEAITSSFGIATADWAVPASMRLGSYRVDVRSEDGPGGSAGIRLSRYDLPTFTVDPKPDRAFYLRGANAVIDVRANYLFGKPLLHGHVRVVREDERTWNFREQRYDTKEGAALEGELDAGGGFLAHVDLQAEASQLADEQGANAFRDVHLAAYVTDASTGRTEQRRFDVRVTAQALHVYVTGLQQQTRGLPMHLYTAVTAADGTPAECDLDVLLLPPESADPKETPADRRGRALLLQHIHTNERGLARVDLERYEALMKRVPSAASKPGPEQTDAPELMLIAHDKGARIGETTQVLQEPEQVLRVSTAKSIYRAGDAIDVTIDAAEAALPVSVQLLRRTHRGDVVLASRDVTLKAGHAQLSFAQEPSNGRYSGLLFVAAIALRDRAGRQAKYGRPAYENDDSVVFASRAVLFPRDNTLHVEVHPSKAVYRPGEEAVTNIRVRGPQDPDGDDAEPAPAAVGLVAVDQAVEERNRTDAEFGEGEQQTFFFASRYYDGGAAGGVSLVSLEQLDLKKPAPADLQLAAEILLEQLRLQPEIADTAPPSDLAAAFQGFFNNELSPLRRALADYIKLHLEAPTDAAQVSAVLAQRGIELAALRDPWGEPYEVTSSTVSWGMRTLELRSRGPDKQVGTSDDFTVALAGWRWTAPFERDLQRLVNGYHDRTGRFIRDEDALHDEAQHEGIAIDAWRDPWDQPFTFEFGIAQANYMVYATSKGDPDAPDVYGPIRAAASINYFDRERARIENVLNDYARTHAYPTNDAELKAAGVSLADIRDPWGHGLYATFRARSFFTDRVKVEAHATPGSAPETRTTVTPVTEVADVIVLHSAGVDGQQGTQDDFDLASFTHVRTQQSAKEDAASRPANQTVRSGQTGALMGEVKDPSGAIIAGALLVAMNLQTKVEFEAKSDDDGGYKFDPIPAGEYDVNIQFPGFMALTYHAVKVIAPDATLLDVTLNVASATETVMVEASAPMLDTSSASVGGVISANMIMALPMAGVPQGGRIVTATPRLRDYFPETLLWRPEIITNADGSATARFRVADSITTWKLSAAASTRAGNTGAGVAQFRSFQPFFAAFDPPRILTIGDRIALPITLRNYLDHAITVHSELKAAPWFRIKGDASATMQVPSGDSASPVFSFTATEAVTDAPQQFLTRGSEAGDNIAKPVTVHPEGLPTWVATSSVLQAGENLLTLDVPADAVAGGNVATLKLYPNLAAHLRDSLVAIAEYPHGCAEQITSTAWPSLLLQRYAAALPQPDRKLAERTHRYLEEAYENLLDKQMPDGGFGYWANDRYADAALTAYVVQFLVQAGKYIAIDEELVKRAVAYLAREQEKDGHWIARDREHQPLPVRDGDKYRDAMLTASIAAMIMNAPGAPPLVVKALAATQPFVAEFDEPYTLASYALAALGTKDTTRSDAAILRLRAMALSENGGAYWNLETNTPFFGWGRAGRVEATAQTLRALLAAGATPHDDLVTRGLLFLDHEQDRHSLWYSTQATARVLDVLSAIAFSDAAPSPRGPAGSLLVAIDGHVVSSAPLPASNRDAGPIFVPLGAALGAGPHRITLTLPQSAGAATAQVVANIYRPIPPAAAISATTNNEQLRMSVSFDSTSPAVGAPVEVTAHIERIGFRGYGMLIAEIGLPPGADVDRASLQTAMAKSGYQINQYEVLPDRLLVYCWPRAGGADLKFRFTLRYGIVALTAPSTVYDFYNPDSHFDVPPVRITSH